MLAVAVAGGSALALLLLVALVAWWRRPGPGDEVESFRRARAMTTQWSRTSWGGPPLTPSQPDGAVGGGVGGALPTPDTVEEGSGRA